MNFFKSIRIFVISFVLIGIIFFTQTSAADTIDVLIKGVDDGIRTNKQQDYKEALMNAELQAIERAGVEIASISKVVNFKLKFDMVESKAKAILLPGFQVMDMGYQTDGSYQVVLSGKVQLGAEKAEFDFRNLKVHLLYFHESKPTSERVAKILREYGAKVAFFQCMNYDLLYNTEITYNEGYEEAAREIAKALSPIVKLWPKKGDGSYRRYHVMVDIGLSR